MHAVCDYITANMEIFLGGRMLDDLTPVLVKQLAEFVRKQQSEKYPFSRSTEMFNRAMEEHGEWLALQDIPQPTVCTSRPVLPKESPKPSPSSLGKKNRCSSNVGSLTDSPAMRPLATIHLTPHSIDVSSDEIFIMDDADFLPASSSIPTGQPSPILLDNESSKSVPAWKRGSSAPRFVSFLPVGMVTLTAPYRVDMKSIIAEAESNKLTNIQVPFRTTALDRIPERKKRQPLSVDVTEQTRDSLRLTGPPWKSVPPAAVSPMSKPPPSGAAVGVMLIGTPPSMLNRQPTRDARSSTTTPVPVRVIPPQPAQPGLGPVFVPSRQSSTKFGFSSSQRIPYVRYHPMLAIFLTRVVGALVRHGHYHLFGLSSNHLHLC